MSSDVEKKFKRYIGSLERELTILNSQYRLLIYLSDAKYDRSTEFRYAKYFFHSIINSLFTDVLLVSTKLLECDRSDRNIPDFLHFVECHLSLFSPEAIRVRRGFSNISQIPKRDYSVDPHLVQSDRVKLHLLDPIVKNLKKKRDKYYAHYDKSCFDEPGKLKTTSPVTRSDIETLIRTCFKILERYSLAFDGEGLSITLSERFDVVDIFDLIKKHLGSSHRRPNTAANNQNNDARLHSRSGR